jgi:hypothetical protein
MHTSAYIPRTWSLLCVLPYSMTWLQSCQETHPTSSRETVYSQIYTFWLQLNSSSPTKWSFVDLLRTPSSKTGDVEFHEIAIRTIHIHSAMFLIPVHDLQCNVSWFKKSCISIAGWWYTYPSEKYDNSSVGMMKISQYMESHNPSRFQTTNQRLLTIINHH